MTGLVLTVGGARHEGWKSASVSRSIETISGAFEVTVSEHDPGIAAARSIVPGLPCTVALDGETVITGHVDAGDIQYDATSHEIVISGRDRTADLVDCSAEPEPGTWADATLEEIAAAIAKPFGISVTVVDDQGDPFRKFTLERGEKAFEAIDRLCRLRGLLPISDGLGGIEIGRAVRDRAGVALERGVNILSARGRSDWSRRYSEYEVIGQQAGGDQWGEASEYVQVRATAEDAAVTRRRPLTIIAEQGVGVAEAQTRADWEAAVRRGRSRVINYEVQGWRETPGGKLWAPGRLVRIRDDWMGLEADMLVAATGQEISDGGTVTRLALMFPDAFLPEPEKSPSTKGTTKAGTLWIPTKEADS